MMTIFCAATYACSNELPALATATGNDNTVRTLNNEIPRTGTMSLNNKKKDFKHKTSVYSIYVNRLAIGDSHLRVGPVVKFSK